MQFSQISTTFTAWRRRHRPQIVAENFLQRWGGAVVAVFAFFYYASYYRSGLNLGGEGGTVAVVAMRLMDGWLPIKETFLGYNLMWFYPVVWLFEIFGPNYIALRIFFFALCMITGVMAFFIVRRVTGAGWYATLAALLPVLIPGMLFRNYMAFLAVLNMLTFLQAYVFTQRTAGRQVLWMLAAGLSLGLTFLVRVDLGLFFSVIALGLVVVFPFARAGGVKRNVCFAAIGLALLGIGLVGTHAPFFLDARKRGYEKEFVGQYTGWAGLIHSLLVDKLGFDPFEPAPTAKPIYTPSRVQFIGVWLAANGAGETAPGRDLDPKEYRQKETFENMAEEKPWSERIFPVVTYLPILVALAVVIPSALGFLLAVFRRDAVRREKSMILLVAMGSALTLFPQFFFFRPDTPHLSELMVPFFLAMTCAAWFGAQAARRDGVSGKVFGGGVVALCVVTAAFYVFHAFPKESAGTIAARDKRNREMIAENSVRVFLKKSECTEIQELVDLIKARTKPGEFVACYPYQPTINFMTDRPAYEYNLYIDNAHNISNFHQETMQKIARHRPAAIIIDNRSVNQTEASRFKNWAATTYDWVRANYIYAGTFRRQEAYLRRSEGESESEKGAP